MLHVSKGRKLKFRPNTQICHHNIEPQGEPMSTAIVGTDSNFKDIVLKSDSLVLVDFWAPWCGPCHMVGPILDEIAADFGSRVKVVKINVDEEQSVANTIGIRSIPTIAIFFDGKRIETLVGARPKSDFVAIINSVLAH